MVEWQIGPGRWLIEWQDRTFGYHYPGKTMMLLMVLEMFALTLLVCAVSIIVRMNTGKTLFQHFSRKPKLPE